MKRLCETAIKLLGAGESFALATVLESSGSTPRGAGSSMIISRGGAITGTIGGGIVEGNVMKAAPDVFGEGRARVMSFTLDGTDAAAIGAICGGTATVLIDYIEAGNPGNLSYFNALHELLKSGGRARILTVLPDGEKTRAQCILMPDGSLAGTDGFSPETLAALEKRTNSYDAFTVLEQRRVFLHPVGTDGTVYIFGAGHCGEKLAPAVYAAGFGAVIIDDREQFASAARFPFADRIIVPESMDAPLRGQMFGDDDYIVIVTRGHIYDELVLRAALKTNAGYIGMIGSRRKRETIYRHLLESGYTQADIDKVYSPIGIDIGAETPEEIAVSIAAELIKVRAGKR